MFDGLKPLNRTEVDIGKDCRAYPAVGEDCAKEVCIKEVCAREVCAREVCAREVCAREVCTYKVCTYKVCAREVYLYTKTLLMIAVKFINLALL